MPLMSHLMAQSTAIPVVHPPIDIEWVWFCHTLNPVSSVNLKSCTSFKVGFFSEIKNLIFVIVPKKYFDLFSG